jgi:hypothetical protein
MRRPIAISKSADIPIESSRSAPPHRAANATRELVQAREAGGSLPGGPAAAESPSAPRRADASGEARRAESSRTASGSGSALVTSAATFTCSSAPGSRPSTGGTREVGAKARAVEAFDDVEIPRHIQRQLRWSAR